ncbi:hypothetical protein [Chryseobacterium hagamense]|nr:hypothetical protein [Chryseobacterium hagamense]
MRNKIRRQSDWKTWEESKSRQQVKILITHIAVTVSVFIVAACL